MNQTSLHNSLTLFKVQSNLYVSIDKLKELLPTVELALFFAKVYKLDYQRVSDLLDRLFQTDVISVLREGGHSVDLQDYLVDTVPSYIDVEPGDPAAATADAQALDSEVLVQLFESVAVKVAASIQEVGDKLSNVMSKLPSKNGSMVFQAMMKMNRNRPTLGTYQANIQHTRVDDVAVVLDVSGSMTETAIRAILSDVLALTYETNAHLITVSDAALHWEPGTASMADVLDTAAYGGTHYEQLAPLFDRDWGTVVTIADYDSSASAKSALAKAKGHIGRVLDISLVNKPTFLGECLGQLADEVEPLLIGRTAYLN